MNRPPFDESLQLKDLITNFCGNPTPFRILATLNEDDSVLKAFEIFEKSDSKRRVIGIKTNTQQILHLGYNELITLLENLKSQQER